MLERSAYLKNECGPTKATLTVPLPVDAALRLPWSAGRDSIAVSQYAASRLKQRLTDASAEAIVTLRPGYELAARYLQLSHFLRPDQFRFDVTPSTDLLRTLRARPDLLFQIPPRRFEELIGKIFEDLGYEVE